MCRMAQALATQSMGRPAEPVIKGSAGVGATGPVARCRMSNNGQAGGSYSSQPATSLDQEMATSGPATSIRAPSAIKSIVRSRPLV